MIRGIKALDRVLRGEATRLPSLKSGDLDIPTGSLCVVLVILGMVAGACTGVFAVITRYHDDPGQAIMGWEQLLASTLKVPMLFCFTLAVTFPSLYVFNALVGSRLNVRAMFRLVIAALCVMMAVLASLGPIIAFFAASTTSYPFMKLLNVVAYAIGGSLGLSFLLQTLHRLSAAQFEEELAASRAAETPPPPPDVSQQYPEGPPPYPAAQPGPLQRHKAPHFDPRVKVIFRIWVIVFGLVGAQMSWVLRPFIGDPHKPFTFLRDRESHFFEAVLDAVKRLF